MNALPILLRTVDCFKTFKSGLEALVPLFHGIDFGAIQNLLLPFTFFIYRSLIQIKKYALI